MIAERVTGHRLVAQATANIRFLRILYPPSP